MPEVQGSTQEVAIAKCKSAAKQVRPSHAPTQSIPNPFLIFPRRQLGKACVTEDTALCFDALGGLPGPYIKDFMGKVGHDGTLYPSSPINSI